MIVSFGDFGISKRTNERARRLKETVRDNEEDSKRHRERLRQRQAGRQYDSLSEKGGKHVKEGGGEEGRAGGRQRFGDSKCSITVRHRETGT